jgi:hypothetical protein
VFVGVGVGVGGAARPQPQSRADVPREQKPKHPQRMGARLESNVVVGVGEGGGYRLSALCIYSLLSMRGRCPHREQSAHVGASPPLPRSLGCGGGQGDAAKGPVAPC